MMNKELEKIIGKQPVESKRPDTGKRTYVKAAIGSALAVAFSMFMLKYDITKTNIEMAKTYSELREMVTDVRRDVEDMQRAPLMPTIHHERDEPSPYRTASLEASQERPYIVVEPCYRQVSERVWEVTPCSTARTGY